jgi:hypothetical protein
VEQQQNQQQQPVNQGIPGIIESQNELILAVKDVGQLLILYKLSEHHKLIQNGGTAAESAAAASKSGDPGFTASESRRT